jgi:hypothetical protein
VSSVPSWPGASAPAVSERGLAECTSRLLYAQQQHRRQLCNLQAGGPRCLPAGHHGALGAGEDEADLQGAVPGEEQACMHAQHAGKHRMYTAQLTRAAATAKLVVHVLPMTGLQPARPRLTSLPDNQNDNTSRQLGHIFTAVAGWHKYSTA